MSNLLCLGTGCVHIACGGQVTSQSARGKYAVKCCVSTVDRSDKGKNAVEKSVSECDDGDCYARLTIAELSCTAKDE